MVPISRSLNLNDNRCQNRRKKNAGSSQNRRGMQSSLSDRARKRTGGSDGDGVVQKRRALKMSSLVMRTHHPGSAVLLWWQTTEKDEWGYGHLSNLIQALEDSSQVRGVVFVRHVSSARWKQEHGWCLEFHPWKPNKIIIQVETRPDPSLTLEIPQRERK
jgi:hypothetical protein